MAIVLSNDDGVEADGLHALRAALEGAAPCLILAPSGPQSGVGHAVTTTRPLRLERLAADRFGLDGTPADCARVALGRRGAFASERLGGTAPRWLVSGINHGANLGVDVYVSGTAAAAREAAILGYPAIAISQYVGRHRAPDWARTVARARPVLELLLQRPPAPGAFWNVNLPHPLDESPECEHVFCPLDPSAHAFEYDQRDGALHWLSDFHARPRRPEHDVDVCMGGRVSITEIPVQPQFVRPAEVTPRTQAGKRGATVG